MIKPHGGRLTDRVVTGAHEKQIRNEVASLSKISLDWDHYQQIINIATGRFSPLDGFMTQNNFRKVVHDLTLEDGTVWPLPVTLDVDAETAQALSTGEKAGLVSLTGELIGAIEVNEVYKHNKEKSAKHIFGTEEQSHPGVENYLKQSDFFVGGPVFLFDEYRYNDHDLHPPESRVLFSHRGWNTVAGFQSRNAPHRAHEYIQRVALEQVDGLFIQPKLGDKKINDYHDDVIMRAYEIMIDNYYRSDRVVLSVFPNKMNYAGPREAVFDAIVRKNQGCTHFIVGRDHAGVGDYYGEFDSHLIFDEIATIGIETIFFDYSFHCQKCDGMTSEKVCCHENKHHVYPSGTTIREQLRDGDQPPEKMMRPEVSKYIMDKKEPFVTDKLAQTTNK